MCFSVATRQEAQNTLISCRCQPHVGCQHRESTDVVSHLSLFLSFEYFLYTLFLLYLFLRCLSCHVQLFSLRLSWRALVKWLLGLFFGVWQYLCTSKASIQYSLLLSWSAFFFSGVKTGHICERVRRQHTAFVLERTYSCFVYLFGAKTGSRVCLKLWTSESSTHKVGAGEHTSFTPPLFNYFFSSFLAVSPVYTLLLHFL